MWKMKSFFESSLLALARCSTSLLSSLDGCGMVRGTSKLYEKPSYIYLDSIVSGDQEIFFDRYFSIVGCVGLVTKIHQG